MGDSGQIGGEAKSLAGAGYYVVSINYELANPGLITNQQCHADDVQMAGWWVNREVQDVEAFVTALRASGLVKPDKIGIVGGSAGATLAALVALDTTSTGSDWPHWNAAARPACAVFLSAVYDFSDRTPSDGDGATVMDNREVKAIENFTQTVDPVTHLADPVKQKELSPVTMVKPPTLQEPFVPLLMVQSMYDPTVPHHQLDDMLCALESNGIDSNLYQIIELPYNDLHSFHYWGTCDDFSIPCTTVSEDVITFLDAHLK